MSGSAHFVSSPQRSDASAISENPTWVAKANTAAPAQPRRTNREV
jgi:hypothetical protein